MLSQKRYITLSLELHLFFARIMKEHAIFLEAGFMAVNEDYKNTANTFKNYFENVLSNAVGISSGFIRPDVLASGEIVTDFTLGAEQKTEAFTGIKINQDITINEAKLYTPSKADLTPELYDYVVNLNSYTKKLLDSFISFKENVLNMQVSCYIATANYPLLIEHIIREARRYYELIEMLERGEELDTVDIIQGELFWDQIMMEHALFIRGVLDPSENNLILMANDFANDYNNLLNTTAKANEFNILSTTTSTLAKTVKFRGFKESAIRGIAGCKIRSIALPLLADHVLREANHYIRILQTSKANL